MKEHEIYELDLEFLSPMNYPIKQTRCPDNELELSHVEFYRTFKVMYGQIISIRNFICLNKLSAAKTSLEYSIRLLIIKVRAVFQQKYLYLGDNVQLRIKTLGFKVHVCAK